MLNEQERQRLAENIGNHLKDAQPFLQKRTVRILKIKSFVVVRNSLCKTHDLNEMYKMNNEYKRFGLKLLVRIGLVTIDPSLDLIDQIVVVHFMAKFNL